MTVASAAAPPARSGSHGSSHSQDSETQPFQPEFGRAAPGPATGPDGPLCDRDIQVCCCGTSAGQICFVPVCPQWPNCTSRTAGSSGCVNLTAAGWILSGVEGLQKSAQGIFWVKDCIICQKMKQRLSKILKISKQKPDSFPWIMIGCEMLKCRL